MCDVATNAMDIDPTATATAMDIDPTNTAMDTDDDIDFVRIGATPDMIAKIAKKKCSIECLKKWFDSDPKILTRQELICERLGFQEFNSLDLNNFRIILENLKEFVLKNQKNELEFLEKLCRLRKILHYVFYDTTQNCRQNVCLYRKDLVSGIEKPERLKADYFIDKYILEGLKVDTEAISSALEQSRQTLDLTGARFFNQIASKFLELDPERLAEFQDIWEKTLDQHKRVDQFKNDVIQLTKECAMIREFELAASTCLSSDTCTKKLYAIILFPYQDLIKECVRDKAIEDIIHIFPLLSDLKESDLLYETIKAHLDTCVKETLDSFISAHQIYARFTDMNVIQSFDRVFQDKLNQIPDIATILVKQLDTLLKSKESIETLQEATSNIVILFKYSHDKDIFYKLYSKCLAKRFLVNNYHSPELEQHVISKIKEVCGHEYTSKLQKLYQDFMTSAEISSTLGLGKCSNMTIVSTGSWPLDTRNEKSVQVQEIQEQLDLAQQNYQAKFKGKKLIHLYSNIRTELLYNEKYMLTCSLYQANVLMHLGNSKDKDTGAAASLGDLCNMFQIELKTLVQHLGILFKAKVLTGISVKTDKLSDAMAQARVDTVIELNPKFSSSKRKINLFQFLKNDDNASDSDSDKVDVTKDRQIVIEAGIVRIMKRLKKTSYTILINEIIGETSRYFKPNIGMIKRCIDTLLQKKYLEYPSADEKTTLLYVA